MDKMGWILALIFLVLGAEGHVKLNVPRVRLPYFEHLSVNFTLKVDTPGCYTWSVSRKDVVTITPSNAYDLDGTSCSDSVVISTIPRVTSCCPASAIVFAEDAVTKETVRCDVIIDKISSIQILTTTKELHLEEAPSKFHIQGYGSKDNELSTLDGVPFTWLLESTKQKETSTVIDPQSIMRFIPFSESPYKASPGIASLEERRMQGDKILLEGIKTGSAEVIARVNDPMYKGLEARVRIIVVASLMLEPSEVYIIPGTTLPLELFQIKHGKKYEIRLPSSVYMFSVENETVASYDRASSEVTALSYGEASISVMDKNWVDELEEQSEALTAKIHVREPKYLSLSVYPYKYWALCMGLTYEVVVDVYDAENQKIFVGDNIFVQTKFDPMYFRVDYSSPNGTYHIGMPIRTGSAYVTAVLEKITLKDGTEVTPSPQPRVKTEMEIFQNIVLQPKEIVLPWDPNVMPKYDLRWNPSGGNGNFNWGSTNSSVVTVSQQATGRTEWFGSVNVSAASSVNPHIQGISRVHILPPIRMEIVEHIVEAEIGTAIQVPLAFYTIRPNDPNRTEVPYSSCGKLPVKVEVEDPNFIYDDKTHYPNLKPACVVLPVVGNALGSSLVTVSYQVGEKYFEDKVTVSTFKPLKTVEPENDIVVLPIGSSKQLVFEGGPRPLLEKHAGFVKTLKIENSTVVSSKGVKLMNALKDDVYVYEVLCKELGDTDVIFQIGNTKVSEFSQPIVRIRVVRVICSEPAQMYFKVESALKSKCPNDGSSAQVVRVAVPNYEPSEISVVVKDKDGRKFDNITSLLIEWKSLPAHLDFATPSYSVTEPIITPLGYVDTGKGLQTVIPRGLSGNVEVSAIVKGYRTDVLKLYGLKSHTLTLTPEDEAYELEHSMDLTLVADVSIQPSASVSLFNHPSSQAIVKVLDGSGFFELDTGLSKNINVSYSPLTKSIEIKPLAQGHVKLILRDLCVSTKRETVIDVDVTGIGKIEVISEDKVPVSGEKVMTVSLQDHSGKLLPYEIMQLAQLTLRPMAQDILEVIQLPPAEQSGANKNPRVQYKLKGKKVGVAEVVFSAGSSTGTGGGVVISAPKLIDVFPPLLVSPKKATMIMGNSISIGATGGPSDSEVEFSSSGPKNIVLIDKSSGYLKAFNLGDTKIIGKAVDPVTKIVFSEDFVEVKVVKLTGLMVVSPLNYLYEGEKMPIWVQGIAGKTIISMANLASASPSLIDVRWSFSNPEFAEGLYVFEDTGYSTVGKQLRIQLHALKAGNLTIKAQCIYMGQTIASQQMQMDIRKYPHGLSGGRGKETIILTDWATVIGQNVYYFLFLPLLVTLAVIIGTITYNGYVYGEHGRNGAKVDTSLFITSPNFGGTTPRSYLLTPSGSSASSTPSRAMHSGGGDSVTPTSSQHTRLYSQRESGLYGSSGMQSGTPERYCQPFNN